MSVYVNKLYEIAFTVHNYGHTSLCDVSHSSVNIVGRAQHLNWEFYEWRNVMFVGRAQHLNWEFYEWRNEMFADETRISLRPDTRRQRVWRRKGRGRKSENVQEVYAFG